MQVATRHPQSPLPAHPSRQLPPGFPARRYQGHARWSSRFKLVVGVVHTHYSAHAAMGGGLLGLVTVGAASRAVCRIHCHKVGGRAWSERGRRAGGGARKA